MDGFQLSLPKHRRLTDEQLRDLISKAQSGDNQARTELIEGNLRLVMSIISRFKERGFEMEDLFQVGTIGLVKAIDSFNLDYEVKFSTYAVPKVIGEIKRHIRESSPLHISRSLKELASQAISTKDRLATELDRAPTIQEIADELQVAREELVAALDAVAPVQSLHQVIHENDGEPVLLEESLPSLDDHGNVFLREALKALEPMEQKLLLLRYFAEKSQSEVAATLGVSQAQVSRLEKRILGSIRKLL